MASYDLTVASSGILTSTFVGPLRYLARQPILDLMGRVHAYELLFRSSPDGPFQGDGECATRTVIDNTVMFGLGQLTGGLPAFVNCTAETLLTQDAGVLAPSMTVLEILENIQITPEVVAAVRRLKVQGHRIALDDFAWNPAMVPLIRLADFIKVDFMQSNAAARRELLAHLGDYSGVLLAEKVESREEYEQARSEGFTLFQGYYFCKPVLLTKRKVPANKFVHLQLLQVLQQQPLNLLQISELVKRDPALTYRLLRLVNSAAFGVRQEVRSIQTALVALGDDLFRRIATVAIASDLNTGKPDELLRMAFVRGRFCELNAAVCGFPEMEQYLLGIFSLLPAMLEVPMEEVTSSMPLPRELQAALLGSPNRFRCTLLWLEAHERGDWVRCDQLAAMHGLPCDEMNARFAEAVMWADQILPATAVEDRGCAERTIAEKR